MFPGTPRGKLRKGALDKMLVIRADNRPIMPGADAFKRLNAARGGFAGTQAPE